MAVDFKSSFRVNATLVPNEFIDTYMASANGEYIKEYLFLLRHEGEAVTVSTELLARKAERMEVQREVSSVRATLRTSMRHFPHIRALAISLPQRH